MKDLLSFYQNHINTTAESLAVFKKRLTFSSILRLSVFLIGIYFAFFTPITLEIKVYISIAVLASFLFLLKRHQKIVKEKKFCKAKNNLFKIEKEALHGNFEEINKGLEYLDPHHDFANDIDIFGKNSLFQHINRSQLKDGEKELVNSILSNDTSDVTERQKALKELAALTEWRFDFTARASLTAKDKEHNSISEWMTTYQRILPKKIKILTYVFSSISILTIVGSFYDLIPNNIPYILFFIGLSLTGFFFKKVTRFIAITSKAHQVFADYEKLFELIENQKFDSILLNDICAPVKNVKDKTASSEIKKYAKLLSAIDQRNNVIVAIFINGFFLTEIRLTNQLEDWVERNGSEVAKWLEVLAKMDALNSLANYVYNHPTFIFPTIDKSNKILSTKNAAHPTMDRTKRVGNDVDIAS